MKIIIQSIEIPPTPTMNPLGTYTHLLRMAFQHEDEETQGLRTPTIYCLYSREDNSLGQITEDGAGEMALAAAFKNAETSRPEVKV